MNGSCKCQNGGSNYFKINKIFYTKEGRLPVRPYQCNFCEEKFVKKFYVKTHIRVAHESVKPKFKTCRNCEYK